MFAGSLFRHFQGIPLPKPSLALTIALLATTGLTAWSIIAGWSYGVRYQGTPRTVTVTIVNLLFAGIAWSAWLLTRIRGRYRMQIAFGFTLFAWIFWYAHPYLGELP